jgi:hypothetical protein
MIFPPMPNRPPRRPFWTRGRRILIGAALGAGAAVGAILAVTSGTSSGTDDSRPHASRIAPDPAAASPVEKCVISWNENNSNKASIGSMNTLGSPTAYVNVSFSSLFPDRCLITVANPSNMYAQQYMEETGDSWSFAPSWTGSANNLDSSVTDWNGSISQDGTIHLN